MALVTSSSRWLSLVIHAASALSSKPVTMSPLDQSSTATGHFRFICALKEAIGIERIQVDFGNRSMPCGKHAHKSSYYDKKLSASRLFKCYEIASPRIKQYLNEEIDFVISSLCGANLVLELGCGYGRVMRAVAPFVSAIVGNDISRGSLELAKSYMKPQRDYELFQMDASNMGFRAHAFDLVFCIQNGVSAFGVNRKRLVAESIRVTKENGIILFSSYSDKIWKDRLDWFREQAQMGLIGEIDEDRTRDGSIVCKDGFTATTISSSKLTELFEEYRLNASIVEVDESSVFCKVIKE